MYNTMTNNDVRRLLIAASSFELKYANRMSTVHEVMFTLTLWLLAGAGAWLL